MWYLLLAVVVGAAVGRARGGRFAHLGARPVRAWGLLPVGAALQLVPELAEVPGALAWVAASYAALALFGLANFHLVGMGVVVVGLAMNLLVVLVNGAMPVRPAALVAAGVAEPEEVAGLDLGAKRRLEEPGDRLTVLGDVIPLPVAAEVLSFGDLVLAVGLADVVANLLRAPRQPRRRPHGGGARSPGADGTGGARPPARPPPLQGAGPARPVGAPPAEAGPTPVRVGR